MAAMRALVLTGGIGHPFEETGPALAAILTEAGFAPDLTEDIEAGLQELAAFDLLVVQCLRWSMSQHEKYARHRNQWAFSLSAPGRAAIERHLGQGRGLLGIHTAAISFDAFGAWGDLLGVRWVWGRSHHPPVGEISVRRTSDAHPVTAGIGPFTVVDELYSAMEIAPGARVLAEASVDGTTWQPAVVVSDAPARRAAYVAFGHDMRAFAMPEVRALVGRAARFAAGSETALAAEGSA